MAGTRYLRFILFAALCLTIVFFLSSSSAPTTGRVTESVERAGEALRDKLKGQKPINERPQLVPQPGNVAPIDVKQGIKDEMNKIPQPEVIKPPKLADTTAEKPSSQKVTPDETVSEKATTEKTTPNQPPTLKGPMTKAPLMNATFVSLARNSDIWEISESIRQVEDRFNHKFGYDWVFLNDAPFDETFKAVTSKLVSGTTKYGLIGEDHWSFPSWIDQDKAAAVRKDMAERKIIYGDSVSYRHMCRFESGFFFRQPLMMDYEWYWRVEPSIKLYCDVDYDVFKFMADNKKKYSFVISLFEYVETIPTMWDSVKKYMKQFPQHIAKRNSMAFLSDDGGDTYNHCHFWSNFEIGNLNWLRSKAYLDFFNVLDKDGGFFYERWGDAPVHSIAASLLLDRDEIHFFNDIGYWHVPFTHCPNEDTAKLDKKCHCDPAENFDWNGYSCTSKWYDLHGLSHPEVH